MSGKKNWDWKRLAVRIPIPKLVITTEPTTGPWLNEETFKRASELWKSLGGSKDFRGDR